METAERDKAHAKKQNFFRDLDTNTTGNSRQQHNLILTHLTHKYKFRHTIMTLGLSWPECLVTYQVTVPTNGHCISTHRA